MSADFLSRLVERAMGTADRVRPVVAPLFAPGPATLATNALREVEHEEAVPDVPLAPLSVRTAGIASRGPDASREPGVARSHLPDRLFTERAHLASSKSGEAVSLAIAGALQPEASNASHRGDPDRTQAASFAPMFTRGRAPDPARRVPADARRPQPAELRETTPRLRPREIDAPPRSDRVRVRRPETSSSSAPIVRISIGRVEVRAVASREPVGPRVAPTLTEARLSLEEYLRPRSGRR